MIRGKGCAVLLFYSILKVNVSSAIKFRLDSAKDREYIRRPKFVNKRGIVFYPKFKLKNFSLSSTF